jgi:hypothetical protein
MQAMKMKLIKRLLVIIVQALIVAMQAACAYTAEALAREIDRF